MVFGMVSFKEPFGYPFFRVNCGYASHVVGPFPMKSKAEVFALPLRKVMRTSDQSGGS